MQPGELRPADRLHLGRRVQLHRARAERDHRAVQGDVEVGQPSQVAQHRGLAAVSAEHRMGEERRGAPQAGRQHVGRRFGQLHVGRPLHLADRGHELPQLLVGGGLVAAGLQRAIRRQVQVVARGPGPVQGVDRLVPSAPEDDPDSVEEVTTVRSVTIFVQGGGEHRGATVRTPGDGGQPVGPVIGGVHGGGHGQQDLGRADVAGRLLAADVLFTGLQREAVGGPAVSVHRHPDQPAGQLALKRVADRDVSRVRPAEEQRHAEPLAGAHRDVRAQLAGRREQGQREQVGGHRGQRAAGVRGLDQRPQVADDTRRAGELEQHAEQVVLPRDGLGGHRFDDQVDAERLGPGAQHGERLGQAVGVGEEDVSSACGPPGQRHGLHRGGGLVQQRGASPGQRGQVGDHGLEVQQRLEPALGDLGLVGGVRRVPGGVLQHVAADDGRRDGVVVAQADHRGQHLVPAGHPAQLGEGLGLGQRVGQAEVSELGVFGQRGADELVERGIAEVGQHVPLGGLVGPDVACGEICHGEPPRTSAVAGSPSVAMPGRSPRGQRAAPEMPVPSGSCA